MLLLSPGMATILMLSCCLLVVISTLNHKIYGRAQQYFLNMSASINFNDNFLCINFFSLGGWALFMVTHGLARCGRTDWSDLEFRILLHLLLKCWDYCEPPWFKI